MSCTPDTYISKSPLRPFPLALSGLSIVSRCRPDRQLLQLFGQHLELLACAEFVQTINANLNGLCVVGSDIVDLFGVAH